jgi:tripartite-type tricarboxylate transporter receptor subunit TctC
MKLCKRSICFLMVLALMSFPLAGCSSDAKVEEYPANNINAIIPWGAGGGTDILARTVGPIAEEVLGKSIIMNNKGGASSTIGHEYVYGQDADGYTLLFGTAEPTIFQVLGLSELSYDEFEPIIILAKIPGVLVVDKDSPYNTFEDFIKDVNERPGEVTMGMTGVGGLTYMASLIISEVTGSEFNTAYFDGDGPLITSLMGKQIDATIVGVGAATQYINSGDFKGLAVISNETVNTIPEVPALGDLITEAQDNLKVTGPFFGVYVKKETPAAAIDKLSEAFNAAVEDERFIEFCNNSGYTPLGLTGEEAQEFISGWQSQSAWLLYDAGAAVESPEKFGIERLK